jgi:hypothetical protein
VRCMNHSKRQLPTSTTMRSKFILSARVPDMFVRLRGRKRYDDDVDCSHQRFSISACILRFGSHMTAIVLTFKVWE